MTGETFGGGFRVRALGEVALRCRDVARVARFYGETLGLERLARREGGIARFRLGEGGPGGPVAVLALVPAGGAARPGGGAPHHLALTVTPHDQARAADWFRRLGVACRFEDVPGLGRRGLFVADPEGNAVALVAAAGAPEAA